MNCVKLVIIISEVSGKHLNKRSLADIKCHETGRFYRYFNTIFFFKVLLHDTKFKEYKNILHKISIDISDLENTIISFQYYLVNIIIQTTRYI